MSDDKPTAPPAKTPSSPGGSSSTTSWPATEVAVSEPGDSTTATPSSPVDSPPSRPGQADTARSLEASSNEDGSPDDGADRDLKTPSSPTWSRSKLPVSEDERENGAVEPVGAKSLDSNTGDAADKDDQPAIDDVSTSKSATARPAFVVTRPTAMGENEIVSVTQPSTPSASVHEDDDKPVADPALKAVEVALKPASTDSSHKPVIQITTFLPETHAFVASPASTNLPSAISPRTSAFFSSDFSMSGPRSPPRPGGAIIMELPSDVELDVDIEVRRATRTVVSSNAAHDARAPPALPQRTSPAASTKHRSRSPSPQPPPPRERGTDKLSSKSRDRRSRSRQRRAANLSDADSSASEPDAGRAPFLPRRTVVSSAAPFLSRTESLREQSRRREQELERERERWDEDERVRAQREAAHEGRQRASEDRRRDPTHEDRRKDHWDAAKHRIEVETARRQRAHEPVEARRPDHARREDDVRRDRHRKSHVHDSPRHDAAPADRARKPALARLLDAVQQALDHDPAAYYTLKGLLSEHEHSSSQQLRERERETTERGERRRERDEGRSRSTRDGRDGLAREEQRSYEREKREKRIPVDLLGRAEGGSGSETEVGFEKVTRGGGLRSSRDKDAPSSNLRTPRFFSTDPPRRDSPSPPSYPSHLSPQRTSRTTQHHHAPEPIRPVPVRPHDAPRSRDESERRAPPRPAQTLTLAQAAKLAAGLGDERLAEELRSSGLSGRDKVTKLGERVERDERERRRDEGRTSGKVKTSKTARMVGGDEELKLRRRQGGGQRGESSSSSPHGHSAEDALRSSIFKVRPPVIDDDVPVTVAGSSKSKSSRRRKDRDEPYRSPTTGSAARAASHFDRPSHSAGGGSFSYDFDDFA
ncbi:hypothetical protein JCM8208_004690 [Rhodotorula glutinis]